MRKNIFYSLFLLLLFNSVSFAQLPGSVADDSFPSVDDMINSLTSEKGSETSIDESIEAFKRSMTQKMQVPTKNTAESVRSAIEGNLVVEEVVPEVNRTGVEAIDLTTKRYSPRLKINFAAFPLRSLSGKVAGLVENEDSTELFNMTNSAQISYIVQRIQKRTQTTGVRFEFKDRSVKLTGKVETVQQCDLIELMLRMEPGIDSVQNELCVEGKQ